MKCYIFVLCANNYFNLYCDTVPLIKNVTEKVVMLLITDFLIDCIMCDPNNLCIFLSKY